MTWWNAVEWFTLIGFGFLIGFRSGVDEGRERERKDAAYVEAIKAGKFTQGKDPR